MLTQVKEFRVDEAGGRVGKNDLSSVSSRTDASRTVHIDTDITFGGEQWLAGMEPHPDVDVTVCQRSLTRLCGCNGIARFRESVEERVSLRVDLDSVALVECITQQTSVFQKRCRVTITQLLKQAR